MIRKKQTDPIACLQKGNWGNGGGQGDFCCSPYFIFWIFSHANVLPNQNFIYLKNIFIWLHWVLVAACMWDLVP